MGNIQCDNKKTENRSVIKTRPTKKVLHWLNRVFQGAVIGISAILPGISGGVLCVLFGIYQPMMSFIGHPIATFKKNAELLFPVLIGWALGFVGLARLVEWMFNASYGLATWLFIGLITGMMPSMFKEAGKEGRPKAAIVSLVISTVAILAFLLIIQNGPKIYIVPNIWWFFVCGIFWGISLVLPGLSSSSLLIFLGLYQPMTAGIADLQLGVIIPLVIGVFVTIFASARAINYLLKKHYAVIFHIIIGFVIASTIVIIPLRFDGAGDVILSIVCCGTGLLLAFVYNRLRRRARS